MLGVTTALMVGRSRPRQLHKLLRGRPLQRRRVETPSTAVTDESEGHSSATGSLVSGSAASLTEPNKRFKVIIKVSSGRQNSC